MKTYTIKYRIIHGEFEYTEYSEMECDHEPTWQEQAEHVYNEYHREDVDDRQEALDAIAKSEAIYVDGGERAIYAFRIVDTGESALAKEHAMELLEACERVISELGHSDVLNPELEQFINATIAKARGQDSYQSNQ